MPRLCWRILVSSSAETKEVRKEINGSETVTGVRINRHKSVGLRLGSWKGVCLPGIFLWTDGPVKILGVCFALLLEMNWAEVRVKV